MEEVSAVVINMLEAKVKSIPTNETHAKQLLDVLMLDADFKVLMLSDPFEIPPVFISSTKGSDHGYQTMQFRAQLVRNQMRSGVPRLSVFEPSTQLHRALGEGLYQEHRQKPPVSVCAWHPLDGTHDTHL